MSAGPGPWRPPTDRRVRAAAGVRTSMLPVGGGAALAGAGLEPVGDVVGCVGTVVRLVWAGACGSAATTLGLDAAKAEVRVMSDRATGTRAGSPGAASRLGARRQALRDAVARMLAEAALLGADGVVGVRLTESVHEQDRHRRDYAAVGTAVRVRGGVPGPVVGALPFAATLDGARTAAAVAAGWWPAGIAVGMAAVVRHTDQWARVGAGQRLGTTEPGELEGLSELLGTVRVQARDDLARDGERLGGGHLVLTRSDHRTWRQGIGGHDDDIAETTLVATLLRPVGPPAGVPLAGPTAVRTLTVLPLADLPLTDPARPGRPGGHR